MRVVTDARSLAEAWPRCESEARAAFGSGALYIEELVESARHVEVQVIGDGRVVTQLGERDCTLQRRHQKLMEVAPSPTLPQATRQALATAAVRMARATQYRGLGTFEFLVDATDPARFVFIEANPRLQVEHTVTEEVFGVDLVQAQLRVAGGTSLAEIGLAQADVPAPRGFAIQLRINMEVMQPDGSALPSGGVLSVYEPPTGPGVRVDGFGYAGYRTSPSFDSLLAKLIVRTTSGGYAAAVGRTRRAAAEFRITGVPTNLGFLLAMLDQPDVIADQVTTRWLDGHAAAIMAHIPAEQALEAAQDVLRPAEAAPEDTVPVPRADASPDRRHRCGTRRHRPRGPASGRAGSNEDGTRHYRPGCRNRSLACGRAGRCAAPRPVLAVHHPGRNRQRRAGKHRGDRPPTTSAPTCST